MQHEITGFEHLHRHSDFSLLDGYAMVEEYAKYNGGGMANLYHPKYSVRVLMDEVRKCDILCSRCHMIERYPNDPLYLKRMAERKKYKNRYKPAPGQMTFWNTSD